MLALCRFIMTFCTCSVHEDDRASDLADVASRYDLPDLQEFYQRAIRQDRKR